MSINAAIDNKCEQQEIKEAYQTAMDDSPTISPFFVRGYPKMVDFAIF